MHCFYINGPLVKIQCKNRVIYALVLHCIHVGFTEVVVFVNISGITGIIHVGFTN